MTKYFYSYPKKNQTQTENYESINPDQEFLYTFDDKDVPEEGRIGLSYLQDEQMNINGKIMKQGSVILHEGIQEDFYSIYGISEKEGLLTPSPLKQSFSLQDPFSLPQAALMDVSGIEIDTSEEKLVKGDYLEPKNSVDSKIISNYDRRF